MVKKNTLLFVQLFLRLWICVEAFYANIWTIRIMCGSIKALSFNALLSFLRTNLKYEREFANNLAPKTTIIWAYRISQNQKFEMSCIHIDRLYRIKMIKEMLMYENLKYTYEGNKMTKYIRKYNVQCYKIHYISKYRLSLYTVAEKIAETLYPILSLQKFSFLHNLKSN